MYAIMGRQRLIPTTRALLARLRLPSGTIALPVAPAIGVGVGLLAALAVLAMPIAVLESMAVDSGLAAFVTAAQPPLGTTARLAAAFFAGVASGGLIGFGLSLVLGDRTIALGRKASDDAVPVLRRADAHPDAPARRPLSAHRDLGTPFLEIKAAPVDVAEERALPTDLDTPLATYLSPLDAPLPAPAPLPILRVPEPVAPAPISTFDPMTEDSPQPVAPPMPRFAAHERIETFVMPPADGDPAAPLPQATIHDLLDRLERGVARRQSVPAPTPTTAPEPQGEPSLEDTLDALRALARRVG